MVRKSSHASTSRTVSTEQQEEKCYANQAFSMRPNCFARAPCSKAEAKHRIVPNEMNKSVLPPLTFFSALDIPFHKTRRHFKNLGYIKAANIWEYDTQPRLPAAGLPCKVPAFNIINGVCKHQREACNKSMDFAQLPGFLKEKYVTPFPLDRLSNSMLYRNRVHNQRSNIFC